MSHVSGWHSTYSSLIWFHLVRILYSKRNVSRGDITNEVPVAMRLAFFLWFVNVELRPSISASFVFLLVFVALVPLTETNEPENEFSAAPTRLFPSWHVSSDDVRNDEELWLPGGAFDLPKV